MRHLALGLLLMSIGVERAAAQEYRIINKAVLGGEGAWDYLTVDVSARRLYVTRSTHVMVVDADTMAVVGDIADTPGVHGVAIAPDLGRGFTSNGRAGTATIFDLKTLEVLGQVKTGDNPDAILYDPLKHRVFAFNGRSGDATAFDAKNGHVLSTIPLGGKPEFAVTDGKGRIFVNIEDKSEIVALDSGEMKVKARFPLAPCEEPTGLALDAPRRHLFAACGNKRMAVVDADTGKVITALPIGEGADGAAFDPDPGLAFSSNGDGTLTIVRESSPAKFEVVGNLPTQRGARTLTLDPKTHRLFLATADFSPPPSPTPEQPRPRPVAIPGSFVILVLGR